MLLLVSTLTAPIIANPSLASTHHARIETRVGFVLGDKDDARSLRHWKNDGLMALAFLWSGTGDETRAAGR
jgi:Na+/H+ antiporter NhaA